jgi:hypothetical protein
MEKFAIGALLGMLGGALLVANNYKMRTLVKKGQSEVMEKIDDFMNEKLEKAEEKLEEIKEEKPAKTKKK